MSLQKPSNYALASVDNNRANYINTAAGLGTSKQLFVAITDSGKGLAKARRLVIGVDHAVIPGATLPASVRLTVVLPSGTDSSLVNYETVLIALIQELLGVFSHESAVDQNSIAIAGDLLTASKGVINLVDYVPQV